MWDLKSSSYRDIIDGNRPVSARHARMSIAGRGAQFAPFAALTGLTQEFGEVARHTQPEMTLGADSEEALNRALRCLAAYPETVGETRILCFLLDDKKQGGEYVWYAGQVKKIDPYQRTICLSDGTVISIETIRAIEAERKDLFDRMQCGKEE